MEYDEKLIEQKIMEIAHTFAVPIFPTAQQMHEYTGDKGLYRAIVNSGGSKKWAKRLGLRRKDDGSLCWKCRNAVPNREDGCTWSRNKRPVEGWKAIFDDDTRNMTWFVASCPEFKPSRKHGDPCDASEKQFRGFALEIVRKAIEDYKSAYYSYIKKKEVYDEALRKNKDHSQMVAYANQLEQRYNKYTPENEIIRQFVCGVRDRIDRAFEPYRPKANYAMGLKRIMYDCEKFFASDSFDFYSDMDGERIRNVTRQKCEERLKEEQEKAKKKAEKGKEKEQHDEDTPDEE